MSPRDTAHAYDLDLIAARALRDADHWNAGLVLMVVFLGAFLALALVVGQERQRETCERFAQTSTPCGSGLVQR